jgi:hypothetical protein
MYPIVGSTHLVLFFINIIIETTVQKINVNVCKIIVHPLIANDCVIAITLPETIPAPWNVENKPPAMGPILERPIKLKIYGKNNIIPLDNVTKPIKSHFKLNICE